ncbi:corticotropin-releasing factor-binding protein [Oratosquilla oratoria]|uniref:corticotropin-releasing factor-binding protein n=1 Tax=Oratosquilla oratoria TaxID=337810 RepID=UPI003F76786E
MKVVLLLAVLCVVQCTTLASPLSTPLFLGDQLGFRAKRNSRVIEECMLVGLDEGTYFYKSRGTGDVCGVFLASQPDQVVHVTFDFVDVDCEAEGLVSFVDGWELNGAVFPSEEDFPLEGRFHEFCGKLKKKVFISSQNAAVIQYRVPKRGDGFKITVKFVKNPKPCNILVDDVSGVYTLRNHGKRVNCSITTIFPASVSLLQLSVGAVGRVPNRAFETGVLYRCEKRGVSDYVQIGGGMTLDSSQITVEDSLCGLDSNPRVRTSHILCGMTTVRLVSSGLSHNSATVAIQQLSDLDITPTLMCDVPL